MKKLLFMVIICGCSKNDPAPATGCVTGIRKTTGVLEPMGCWTHDQFLSGSHAISYFGNYTNQKWALCSDCK